MLHKKDAYGRTILNDRGRPVTRLGMAKEGSVRAYQNDVGLIVRSARPSGWQAPRGQIRVYYSFFLRRKIDCDNALKALNDALAMAIGVDDEVFLPCVRSKQIDKNEKNPRLEIEIDDQSDSPSPSPVKSSPSGSLPPLPNASTTSQTVPPSSSADLDWRDQPSSKGSSRTW